GSKRQSSFMTLVFITIVAWRKDAGFPGQPARRVRTIRRMITHLKFVGIPTRNQYFAVAFYTEKLGFKIVTDQPLGDQRWIEMRVGASETRVVLFTPDGQQDRIGTFFNGSFACDNVERTYEELKARG